MHTSEIELQSLKQDMSAENLHEPPLPLSFSASPKLKIRAGFFASEVLIVVFVVLDQIITKEKWFWLIFSI